MPGTAWPSLWSALAAVAPASRQQPRAGALAAPAAAPLPPRLRLPPDAAPRQRAAGRQQAAAARRPRRLQPRTAARDGAHVSGEPHAVHTHTHGAPHIQPAAYSRAQLLEMAHTWVVHDTRSTTCGAPHAVHHTRCTTRGAPHAVHHTRCSPHGAPHAV